MGTARIITRNAYAYENYLSSVFGRDWRLAAPAEIKGPARLKVKFVPEKMAGGEKYPPAIILYVEYNPAMGLYTVRGEYWDKADAEGPAYKSSPRTGFDDEMLGDPSRLFDWLDSAVTFGESVGATELEAVAEALGGMNTAAGSFVDADIEALPDGGMALVLEPEMRMPKDYFVSGTRFPGMTGPDELDYSARGGENEWFDAYVNPVQGMVQSALDNLYGPAAYKAEVDAEGYVVVSALQPTPPQNFKSGSGGAFSRSDNLPTHDNRWDDHGSTGRGAPVGFPNGPYGHQPFGQPMESKQRSSHADAILRMAGVGGHKRFADRSLTEAWYDSGTVIDTSDKPKKKKPPLKFSKVKTKDQMAAFDSLVAKLKKQKADGADIEDPEALAGWIGLRMAGKKGAAARKSKKGAAPTAKPAEDEEKPKSEASVAARMQSLLK